MVSMHGSSGYLNGDGESTIPEGVPVVNKTKRFAPTPEQNKERWQEISSYFDCVCFYFFGASALLVPLIVASTLDRKNLGV